MESQAASLRARYGSGAIEHAGAGCPILFVLEKGGGRSYDGPMRIALATCSNPPDWEVDDKPLHAALVERGVEIVHPVWSDSAFDWGGCDACLIRTTWDYYERREAFVAWAARVAAQTRLFNPFELVQWNTDKHYLRDLESRGVSIVETVWLETGAQADLKRVLAERGWDRAFLKPVIGSTARETLRFDSGRNGIKQATRHLDRMLAGESMMLQPYLSAVETEGELSVILIDGQVSHCVRKIPVPGDYRVQDDFGASDEPIELSAPDLDLARSIVAKVDWPWLYGRVDFLRDSQGQLRLSELEMVEPSFFFRHCPGAADRLAAALCRRLGGAKE